MNDVIDVIFKYFILKSINKNINYIYSFGKHKNYKITIQSILNKQLSNSLKLHIIDRLIIQIECYYSEYPLTLPNKYDFPNYYNNYQKTIQDTKLMFYKLRNDGLTLYAQTYIYNRLPIFSKFLKDIQIDSFNNNLKIAFELNDLYQKFLNWFKKIGFRYVMFPYKTSKKYIINNNYTIKHFKIYLRNRKLLLDNKIYLNNNIINEIDY